MPSANGYAHQSAALPGIDEPVETAPLPSLAVAVETIDAHRPADLGEALELVGEVVTASGNQRVPLDDPGAVWRVTSGRLDVFYVRPEPDQGRGRRVHLCRVEEGGSMFGLERIRTDEHGDLLAVGVGPARLLKVAKTDLLRLSLDSEWRRDVAALVDDWVDRISRATSTGDPPSSLGFLERDEPHQAAPGGCLTARREVLWVRPGPGDIRFLDKVPVPTCPHESRFPLSPHAWISYNQAETIQPWDTETLIENGDPWVGLRRFHQVVLDAIAASLALETAQADARRASARLRDTAMFSTALTSLCLPGRVKPGRTGPIIPAPVAGGGRCSHRGVPGGGSSAGDRGHVAAARRRGGPAPCHRAGLGLPNAAHQADGDVVVARRNPDARPPRGRRPAGRPDP